MALTQVSTGGIKDGQVHTADLADAQITAGKLHADALDHTYTLGASGTDHYTFTGEGLTGAVNDATLYLTRGKTYRFVNGNSSGAHPFRIQSVAGAGGTEYNTGVTNNAGAGGSTIIFEVPHDAPDVLYYICTSHATMNGIFYVTGALADGTVTTAKIADDAVTEAKVAANAINTGQILDNAVNTAKIQTGAVTTAKLANESVLLEKLPHGTSSNDGKFLRANNGADPTFETVNTDLVADTSPQLGGDLDCNQKGILLQDRNSGNQGAVKWGDNGEMWMFHAGSDNTNRIYSSGKEYGIWSGQSNDHVAFKVTASDTAPAIELYYDNSKKLETTSSGISVTGDSYSTTGVFGISSANNIDFTADNRMSIHINGAEDFRFESDGDFHADGDVYAFSTTVSSDENLKKDIVTVGDAVTKVEALKGVTFKWKKNDADSAGVIAQDVEKVLPQVVKTVNDMDGNEYKAVNYAGLTSILIEAIKDLSARIKVLEAK